MRVIVTRPRHRAVRTASRLRRLGHEPVLLPLTEPVHDLQAAATALARPHAALAVTSAEALHALARCQADLAPHRAGPVFAVGTATARAATELGFADVRTGPGDGRGLAETIATNAADGALLYLAGRPRSPHFETALAARNIPLDVVELYRMQPVSYDEADVRAMMGDPVPDAVLLYSAEAARLFFKAIGPYSFDPEGMAILLIGENLRDQVPRRFHGNVRLAATPDEDGLFALL